MTAMNHHGPSIPNAKQREEWNNATGSRWLERDEKVDKQIAPFGRRAVDRGGAGAACEVEHRLAAPASYAERYPAAQGRRRNGYTIRGAGT
jgi:hypothetical protein